MIQENKIKELENKYKFERLEKQLFLGKIIEVIGFEKATKLLKQSKDAIQKLKDEL